MAAPTKAWLDEIAKALGYFGDYAERRRLLFADVGEALIASLPAKNSDALQILSDLNELHRRGCVDDLAAVVASARQMAAGGAFPHVAQALANAEGLLGEAPGAATPQVVVKLNPWPAPDLRALGFTAEPVTLDGPPGRWQMEHLPGDPAWQRAFAGIMRGASLLGGVEGRVDVFASTAYSMAAVLAHRLSELRLTPNYWQAMGAPPGQRWMSLGGAEDHGEQVCLAPNLHPVVDGDPIALLVELTFAVEPSEMPEGPFTEVRLGVPKPSRTAVDTPKAAQQVAHEISEALLALHSKAPRSALHLFYVGPVAVLMMAAGALRVLRDLTIYERVAVDGARFLPAVRFENGTATLL